jgi:hypothetical protein
MRDRQLDLAERKDVRAADVHPVRFGAVFCHVLVDFVVADHRRAGAFGDRQRIPQVIAVRVGHQDVVRFDLLRRHVGHRVARQERIDQQVGLRGLDAETGVAVISDFDGHYGSPCTNTSPTAQN